MKTHLLFPTTVTEHSYDYPQRFKQTFFGNVVKHISEDGYSEEHTGHVDIHLEPEFKEIYVFATNCIKDHLRQLTIDPNIFDIHIVKSWLNVTKEDATPLHSHRDAHLSFVYYVNIPISVDHHLRFYNYEHRHEPFYKCMMLNNSTGEWNTINSYTWSFEPIEGNLFVFPASLPHDNTGEKGLRRPYHTVTDLQQRRVAIAGDVILTYKNKSSNHLGLQPIANWRIFDV